MLSKLLQIMDRRITTVFEFFACLSIVPRNIMCEQIYLLCLLTTAFTKPQVLAGFVECQPEAQKLVYCAD